ncbi:MAG TPA: DUF4126 domain-containing protein, partial [Pyrinomonadaceae bacterium]|nr:DUF4126 domain-containing protein [Pyrinomonadaceae bacterium]
AFLLGGGVAFSSHGTKATARAFANISPEPVSNWALSIFEDIVAIGGAVLVIFAPIVMGVVVGIFLIFFFLFFPRIWRALRKMFATVGALFRGKGDFA